VVLLFFLRILEYICYNVNSPNDSWQLLVDLHDLKPEKLKKFKKEIEEHLERPKEFHRIPWGNFGP